VRTMDREVRTMDREVRTMDREVRTMNREVLTTDMEVCKMDWKVVKKTEKIIFSIIDNSRVNKILQLIYRKHYSALKMGLGGCSQLLLPFQMIETFILFEELDLS